jgi:hypothetical protein
MSMLKRETEDCEKFSFNYKVEKFLIEKISFLFACRLPGNQTGMRRKWNWDFWIGTSRCLIAGRIPGFSACSNINIIFGLTPSS